MLDPKKHHVLVVDDDGLIRAVLRRILATKGYHVVEAATLALGVHAVEKLPIDLVFLDIYLPDGNGLDAMLKMFELRPELKVALISSDTSVFDHPSANDEKVIDTIGKPFTPERIEKVLHHAFGA